MSKLPRLTLVTRAAKAAGAEDSDGELLRLGAELAQIDREWLMMDEDERTDALDEIWPLIDKIMKRKPRTWAGLAVQASAIVFDNFDWWQNETDEDDEQARARVFLESVCSFLGITAAPIQLAAEA